MGCNFKNLNYKNRQKLSQFAPHFWGTVLHFMTGHLINKKSFECKEIESCTHISVFCYLFSGLLQRLISINDWKTVQIKYIGVETDVKNETNSQWNSICFLTKALFSSNMCLLEGQAQNEFFCIIFFEVFDN